MPKAHPQINEVHDDKLICARCEEWKPVEEFAKAPRMKRGRHSWCKTCFAAYVKDKNARRDEEQLARYRAHRRSYQPAYMREWRKLNPEKSAAQALKHRTGLSPEGFEQMMFSQKGECANFACHNPATDLDHDHSCCSGARTCGRCIRGLLCHRCNTRLGWIEKDLDLVRGLIAYRDAAQQRLKDTRA